MAIHAANIPTLSLIENVQSFPIKAKNPWEFMEEARQMTQHAFIKLLFDNLNGEVWYREKTYEEFAELACRLLKSIQAYKGPRVSKKEQEHFEETGEEPRYIKNFHNAVRGDESDLIGNYCYISGLSLPAHIHEAYCNFMDEEPEVREGVILRYMERKAGKDLAKKWAGYQQAKAINTPEALAPVKILPERLQNLKLVFGPLFDEIAARAENALTLDQRIEAFRRWSCGDDQEDLDDMIRMRHERDTEDYSTPGTWYGCVRKWQAMTEEEALNSFQTDWYPWANGAHKQRHSQKDLKAFYEFIKKHPLPPLTPQEKADMYDRRIQPACLSALFEAMDEAGLTGIFEDTYDYSHSEPWTVCYDDFDTIRETLAAIRGDALESFFMAASQLLTERKAKQEAAVLQAGLLMERSTDKEWTLRTPKAVYELAERALLSQVPTERLSFMLQYVSDHPSEADKHAEYIKLLQRLVNEQNGDYSDPVTPWGCLIHFRQLTEDDFIEKLKHMPLHWNNGYMPEEERREAHRRMLEAVLPELPNEERTVLYASGSTLTPTLRKFFMDDLKEPAGELLFEYCGERGNYDVFEAADWVAENALECLTGLRPDLQNAVLKTALQLMSTAISVDS